MNKKITVIGSSNIDFIMKAPHIPNPGETVCDCIFQQTFGGKGANQAVAAARAGGEVTFVSCLGDDPYAPIMMENFKKDGLDVSNIKKFDDVSTGSALIMIDDAENCITVAPCANAKLSPEIVQEFENIIAESDLILLQMEIPLESNREVLEIAAKYQVPVIHNYAPIRDASVPVDGKMHGLIVNEIEASELLGIPEINAEQAAEAAESLRKKGPDFVIITLGSKGAVIASPEGIEKVSAFAVSPVDTTAAGDTFCGSLATAMMEGKPLTEAVRFASAASAIAVTRLGAQPSIPTREEIDNFLQESGVS